MHGPTPAELFDSACLLRNAGYSSIPVNGKRPMLREWSTYQDRLPSEAELKTWYGGRAPTGLAVVCGSVSHGPYDGTALVLLDGDYLPWIDSFEAKTGSALDNVHIRETGSGKRHYVMLTDQEIVGHNRVLARRKIDGKAGFETRENHGYFVYEGLHPETQGLYRPLRGELPSQNRLSVDQVLTVFEIASSFNEVEEESSEQTRTESSATSSIVRLVIDRYKALHTPRERLSAYGYTFKNDRRGCRPGSGDTSVVIRSNAKGTVSVHYSTADELYQKKNAAGIALHDVFSIEQQLNPAYAGDFWRAAKGIAQEVGVRLYYIDDNASMTAPIGVSDGAIRLLEHPGSPIVVLTDSEESARALFEMGVTAISGPRNSLWDQTWFDLVTSYERRYIWMAQPFTSAIESAAHACQAQVVLHDYTPDEMVYGRGANEVEIAQRLLAAKTLSFRVGLGAALKSRVR